MGTASDWFSVERLPQNIMRIVEPGYSIPSSIYVLPGAERVAVIDAGHGFANLAAFIAKVTDLEPVVLLTHGHVDHAGGARHFRDFRIHQTDALDVERGWDHGQLSGPLLQFFGDRELPSGVDRSTFSIPGSRPAGYLTEGDVIDLGARQLDVFHTPGHSPGSASFLDLEGGLLFTGDSLYLGRIAIEDAAAYSRSIEKFNRLAALVGTIYGSHGEPGLDPSHVRDIRRGFYQAMGDRPPDGFLGGMMLYDYGDFGFMLPPRRMRRSG